MVLSLLPMSALAKESPFADVTHADWFYDAVVYVSDEGIMTGTDRGFEPNIETSRAMIWTILARLSGEDTAVTSGDWYANAQRWAVENGVSDGSDPNGSITREQLAAMLYRYLKVQGVDVSSGSANTAGYPDATEISPYAFEAMQWACGAGIINGINDSLCPQGTATRAQVATMLYRLAALLERMQEVTVTFAYNDGSDSTYKTVTVRSGETVDEPRSPARDGYTFAGWYTKYTGGTRFDFDTAITEDLTLYAHWTAKSTGGTVVHQHSYGDWEITEDGHSRSCACDATEAGTHEYSYVINDDTHTATCDVCGYEVTEAHSYDLQGACVCGDKLAENVGGVTDGDGNAIGGVNVTEDENTYLIYSAEGLVWFSKNVEIVGNKTVLLTEDINLSELEEGSEYATAEFSNKDLTFDGQNHTISGLTAPLINFYGGTCTVRNLTIADSEITGNKTWNEGESKFEYLGTAALVEIAQWCDLYMENCHVKDTTVTSEADTRSGALVGYWIGGGEIRNCTVTNVAITNAGGTVGGIVGHRQVQGDYEALAKVTNCTVKNSAFKTTDGSWRIGTIIGSVSTGTFEINDCTSADNTMTQKNGDADVENPNHELYGRIVSGGTLKIIVNGAEYISDGVSLASDGTYEISSPAGLQWFATKIGSYTGTVNNDISVKLTADIDMAGESWNAEVAYTGLTITFDGNSHTIKNLTTTGNKGGLFCSMKTYGDVTIRDLTLENISMTGKGEDKDGDTSTAVLKEAGAGALIGYYNNPGGITTIENVNVKNVSAANFKFSGGLIGYVSVANTATIKNCTIDGTTVDGVNHVGGLVGYMMNSNADKIASIVECEMKNLAVKSTGSSKNREGAIVGTLQANCVIDSGTIKNVTVMGSAASKENLVGSVNNGTVNKDSITISNS